MRGLAIFGIAALLAGCSAEATVRRNDGRMFEGKITRSDKDNIYMGEQAIARKEIRDIDHPGNGIGTFGAVVAGGGGIIEMTCLFAISRTNGEEGWVIFAVVDGALILVPGIIMAIWGFSVWNESKAAAEVPRIEVAPAVVSDGERGYAGGVLVYRW